MYCGHNVLDIHSIIISFYLYRWVAALETREAFSAISKEQVKNNVYFDNLAWKCDRTVARLMEGGGGGDLVI